MNLTEDDLVEKPLIDYINESERDVIIPMENLLEYMKNFPCLLNKWSRYLSIENTITNRLEEEMKSIHKTCYIFYMYKYKNADPNIKEKIDNKNIEEYIKGDENYSRMYSSFKEQDEKRNFVSRTLDQLKTTGYLFKTIQQQYIIDNGVNI